MDFKKATTRLRKTFAYPSDDDDDSPRHRNDLDSDYDDDDEDGPAYDEQEQEDLIRSLAAQNAARNAQFRLFLLAVPALSTIPYLLFMYNSLFGNKKGIGRGGGGGGRDTYTAILSLTSLACTTWTLYSLPPGETGIRVFDARTGVSSASTSNRRQNIGSAASPLRPQHHPRSPLETYLPYLNAVLCGILVVTGLLSSSSSRSSAIASQHWGHVSLAYLPAIDYAVVLAAKMLMGSVDPERELNALRYEYKGA
jgi:hypothetical protein